MQKLAPKGSYSPTRLRSVAFPEGVINEIHRKLNKKNRVHLQELNFLL